MKKASEKEKEDAILDRLRESDPIQYQIETNSEYDPGSMCLACGVKLEIPHEKLCMSCYWDDSIRMKHQ